jgi:thiamine biosynthesis lipoprotein
MGSNIDLGGIGKEWCVDSLVMMIKQEGINHVMVELGGDCAAHGHQPGRDGWAVLLPGVAGAVILKNEAIATSGLGTRGRWLMGQWIPHLIDAVTGKPASGVVLSASIIAPTCVVAGIHASDLCLLLDSSPVEIMVRNGNYPTWLRLHNGAWWGTTTLTTGIYPVEGLAA